jgi:hypothetical protein
MNANAVTRLGKYARTFEWINYNLTSLHFIEVVGIKASELNWSESESAADLCLESYFELLGIKQVEIFLRVVLPLQNALQEINFVFICGWR